MAAPRLPCRGARRTIASRWRPCLDSNPFQLLELLVAVSRDVTGRRLLQGAGQQRSHIRDSLGPYKSEIYVPYVVLGDESAGRGGAPPALGRTQPSSSPSIPARAADLGRIYWV